MRQLCCIAAIFAAGCFHPDPPDGKLACGSGDSCPSGYDCAQGACYLHGHEPPDLSMSPDDLSMPSVDGGVDFSSPRGDLGDAAVTGDAASDLAPPALGDTYVSDCVPAPEIANSVPNAHKRLLISLNPGHTFGTETTFFYDDVTCQSPFVTAATSFSMVAISAGAVADSLYFTSTVQSLQWKPEISAVAQNFNATSNCGLTNWAAGTFLDVTGKTCTGGVLPSAGAVYYSFLLDGGNTLQFAGDATLDASAPWPSFGPPLYRTTCGLVAQTGCSGASTRCSLQQFPQCVGSGALAVGAACSPTNDNCVNGAQCTPTPDGGTTPVCRQACDTNGDCTQPGPVSAPSLQPWCFIRLVSVVTKLCTINCNPVPTLGASGCPPDNQCHVFNFGQTANHGDCVPPVGAGTDGTTCTSGGDCADGFDCVNTHCRAYCRTGTNGDCAAGTCVNTTGVGAFGHCCPSGVCS